MRTPAFTLALLLLAAAGIFYSGSRLARREVEDRRPVERGVFEEFGGALGAELARLSALYEHDVTEVAAAAPGADTNSIRAQAQTVHGIREVVFVAPDESVSATVVSIASPRGDRAPDVVVRWRDAASTGGRAFTLEPTRLLAQKTSSGWLESGTPEFGAFWMRSFVGGFVVVVVDWRDVAEQTNAFLATWIEPAWAPVRAAEMLVSAEGPAGALLAGLNRPPQRRPDLILPLRQRFGTWQVLGGDRSVRRVEYDSATLAIAVAAAGVLALLGVVLFREQRRALLRAEERVSFVNRVSHELSTPLTNALLNLDLASDACDSGFARSRLVLVTEEIQRLARLVANVLTFSRSDRGALALKPAPCVPDEIVDGVLRQFEPALTRRGIVVQRHASARSGALLDPDALAQIVGNLISNVEKYAASGGVLALHTQLESDELVLRVTDRGPGIPAAEHVRVFEPFERVSSRVNEGASGTGLGLAIARDLAQRMGGTLALLPATKGAVFELRVPAPALVVARTEAAA